MDLPEGQQLFSGKYNQLACWSLVLSVVGIMFIPFLYILGFIFGIIALSQIQKIPKKGQWFAILGVLLGAVGIYNLLQSLLGYF